MKIVVLAGGFSYERNVSLASGAMVANSLRKNHEVAFVDLFMGVDDGISFKELSLMDISYSLINVSSDIPKFEDIIDGRSYKSNSIIGKNVLNICREADLVFLALHGESGEDGRIQATLDMLGIPYTGSDYLACAIAMNKDLTKELVRSIGIRTPNWDKVFISDKKFIDGFVNNVEIPVVVKVIDGGSSVGVFIVNSKKEFCDVLELNIGKFILIEDYIEGKEVEMAFLIDKPLPSIEILSNRDFYDYSSKYQKGIATEITPANITKEQEVEIGNILMKVVKSLNLYTYSRADFIIDNDGKIWFIEINSLPGLTSTSLVPQEAKKAGINFDDLCEIIVNSGIKRLVGLDKYFF